MTLHPVCPSTQLDEGGLGYRFGVIIDNETLPAFAVRYQGQAQVYLNRCAHIPVELDFMPADFFDSSKTWLICATHGALFNPQDGHCVSGPCAGQSLYKLNSTEQNGMVMIQYPTVDD